MTTEPTTEPTTPDEPVEAPARTPFDEDAAIAAVRRQTAGAGWGSADRPSAMRPINIPLMVTISVVVLLALAVIPLLLLNNTKPLVQDPIVAELEAYGQAQAAGDDYTPPNADVAAAFANALTQPGPNDTTVLFVPGQDTCWALVVGGDYQPPQRAPGRC